MDRVGHWGTTRIPSPEEFERGARRGGWQHEAASRTLKVLRRGFYRVMVVRRLHYPLLSTARFCQCGQLFEFRGFHRAVCARVGVVGRRGCPLENVVAQICREVGGRAATNVIAELIAGGGRRWAASLRRSWLCSEPSTHTVRFVDPSWGVVLYAARQRKERRCPELVGRPFAPGWWCLRLKFAAGGPQKNAVIFQFCGLREKARSEFSCLRSTLQEQWRFFF